MQIAETETLLAGLMEEKQKRSAKLRELEERERELGDRINEASQKYVSPFVDSLVAQSQEAAGREAELASVRSILQQAEAFEVIREELSGLKLEVAKVQDRLKDARKPNRGRVERLREIYEKILLAVDFPGFRNCSISPTTLIPNINGDLYKHAGTALKGLAVVCYHLALLQLAREEATLLPRMLVIDSPAVGDLNDESHDKLLKYLATIGEQAAGKGDGEWQIILTTRRMLPELERFVIARLSSPDQMLLRGKR